MKICKPFFVLLFCLPLMATAETEPNNTCITANPLTMGVVMTGDFFVQNDLDYYFFDIQSPGFLQIDLNSMDLDAQINCELNEVINCDNGFSYHLKNSGTDHGTIKQFICNPGRYTLRLYDSEKRISSANYQLIALLSTVDLYECNNTFGTAAEIPFNQRIDATLSAPIFGNTLNLHDDDYYKVYVPNQGILKIFLPTIPTGLDMHITLYDDKYNLITNDCNCDSTKISPEYINLLICDPGYYTFVVHNLKSNIKEDNYPYQLLVQFLEDSSECNDDMVSAFPIQTGQFIAASLGGINILTKQEDVDWYAFHVNAPSLFDMTMNQIPDSTNYRISVYTPKMSELFRTDYSNLGLNFYTLKPLCDTGFYFCKVESIQNYPCGVKNKFRNYEMKIDLEQPDPYECNNTISTASPISGNETIMASFPLMHDTDIYQVHLKREDTLKIKFNAPDTGIYFNLKIYNNQRATLLSKILEPRFYVEYINKKSEGEFFISLTGRSMNRISVPYKLEIQTGSKITKTNTLTQENELIQNNITADKIYFNESSIIDFKMAEVKIYNSMGLEQEVKLEMADTLLLNVSSFSSGVYYLVSRVNGRQYLARFVKI